MANIVKYPSPGCIVEYLEDNSVRIAMVLDESSGKLRLLTPTRRETKLGANRLLPWAGPQYPSVPGREEAVRLLEEHKKRREEKGAAIDPREVWELAQGEIDRAAAEWYAELFENETDADIVSAYGRALLGARMLFRFQPPEFMVYDAETVKRRQQEQKLREEKEALVAGGAAFLRMLWEHALQRRVLDPQQGKTGLPVAGVQDRIEHLLRLRMLDPESQEDEALWQLLRKGLPEVPHLPLQLLTAWGKLPPHYNFWLDRAGYDAGDTWWTEFRAEVEDLASAAAEEGESEDLTGLPFISIDGIRTKDIDDAFYIEAAGEGYRLVVALACPALEWQFGSQLDKAVQHRATSIYLPEGNLHMLPENLGIGAYSLFSGKSRPALCLDMLLDRDGSVVEMTPGLARVSLAANLNYADVQSFLDNDDSIAAAFASQLSLADQLARKREAMRIKQGAVVMLRPETVITLATDEHGDIRVDVEPEEEAQDSQRLVSEMMVLASSAIADWGADKSVPLVHRTQNVTIPPEYAGIWTRPEDLARVIRSLTPSVLEVQPRPHAALGLQRYAPVTSPLRRYADLLNEAQILHYIRQGAPRWTTGELGRLLDAISPSLESASQVQRFRPRYWRLLYFRQQGEQRWWTASITEENENFVTVSLPDKGLFVRGRRQLFDERACPGMQVQIRLGKINPLYNEVQITETMPAE